MSKKNETIETPIIGVENDDKCEQGTAEQQQRIALWRVENDDKFKQGTATPDIHQMDIKDLNAYEEACKNICIVYEREIKLNEMEPRNYTPEDITYNRRNFQKFTTIHRRLREIIENKLEKLTEYEGW